MDGLYITGGNPGDGLGIGLAGAVKDRELSARAPLPSRKPAKSKARRPAKQGNGKPAPSRAFHHGDLKATLIREASSMIAERGEADFSLRELAEKIGVTHPAVYRHFRAKSDLLAAIALEGLALCGRMLDGAGPVGRGTGGRFDRQVEKYLEFSKAYAGFYRAMFHPAIRDREEFPAVHAAMAAVMARFGDGASAAFGWSLAHGLAMLALDGRLADPEHVAEDARARLARTGSRRSPKRQAPNRQNEGAFEPASAVAAARPARRPRPRNDAPAQFDLFG